MPKAKTLIRGGLDTLSKFGRSALEYVLQETKSSLRENTVNDSEKGVEGLWFGFFILGILGTFGILGISYDPFRQSTLLCAFPRVLLQGADVRSVRPHGRRAVPAGNHLDFQKPVQESSGGLVDYCAGLEKRTGSPENHRSQDLP